MTQADKYCSACIREAIAHFICETDRAGCKCGMLETDGAAIAAGVNNYEALVAENSAVVALNDALVVENRALRQQLARVRQLLVDKKE
jgi:hypothetical protein